MHEQVALHILHTADWHLGQTFFGYDRDVEQDVFLTWLVDLLGEQQVDVLLITGDVFDVANPSAAAQRRFYRFLKEANQRNPHLHILITAGNHDSAVRLEAPNPLLEELNTTVVGLVHRTDEGEIDYGRLLYPLKSADGVRRAWCLAVPYLRQGDCPAAREKESEPATYVTGVERMFRQLRTYVESRNPSKEPLIAMGHLYMSGSELSADDPSERVIVGGLEAVTPSAFDGLDYVALGHIHKAQRVGGCDTIRYAGSPLPMSFSERGYLHQVLSVKVDQEGGCSVESIPVPVWAELKRIPVKPLPPAEVLEQLYALPEATETTDSSRWPYVEVCVLLTEPAPGFRHQVEEALQNKAVRLTSIVPSYANQATDEAANIPLSYTDLQKIDPVDILRHSFLVKYNGDLPEDLEALFNEVIREVSL